MVSKLRRYSGWLLHFAGVLSDGGLKFVAFLAREFFVFFLFIAA